MANKILIIGVGSPGVIAVDCLKKCFMTRKARNSQKES